jgi:GDP-L-fucose synthase
MNKSSRIYIAGHKGMVGSAIFRRLQLEGFENLVVRDLDALNLLDQSATGEFFQQEKPEYVFLAAAKVGGILANNTYRAEYIYENTQIQNNVIHFAWKFGVKKLLFLGSSCIYPKLAPQPLKEEYLLTGLLEHTNEPYAIAKISGIKMCQAYNAQYGTNFISVMPTNLYGPNDNYNLETSHVLPALIRKMHLGKCLERGNWEELRVDLNQRPIDGVDGSSGEVKILGVLENYGIIGKEHGAKRMAQSDRSPLVTLWGSGSPLREFLHVDDLADACYFLMQKYDDHEFLNIGVGEDLSIKNLALLIKDIVGFQGELQWDSSKPDGTPRKLMDITRLSDIGWKASIALEEGIKQVYQWYLK